MTDEPTMISVFDGRQHCLGFILKRGPKGWESFDADGISLGIYPGKTEAAGMLTLGLDRVPHA